MLDHWGWRTMLIAEGSLPLVWLIVWLTMIQDRPEQAAWLPPTERATLTATLRSEAGDLERQGSEP
jgi:hypothetical protein